jgi:hypothetical protein
MMMITFLINNDHLYSVGLMFTAVSCLYQNIEGHVPPVHMNLKNKITLTEHIIEINIRWPSSSFIFLTLI